MNNTIALRMRNTIVVRPRDTEASVAGYLSKYMTLQGVRALGIVLQKWKDRNIRIAANNAANATNAEAGYRQIAAALQVMRHWGSVFTITVGNGVITEANLTGSPDDSPVFKIVIDASFSGSADEVDKFFERYTDRFVLALPLPRGFDETELGRTGTPLSTKVCFVPTNSSNVMYPLTISNLISVINDAPSFFDISNRGATILGELLTSRAPRTLDDILRDLMV